MNDKLKEKLNPFPKEGYVFGKVMDVKPCSEEFVDYYEITIDIINNNMLEFDKGFYNSENKNYSERPPLYFYYLTIRTTSEKVAYFFDERQRMGYYKYHIFRTDYWEDYKYLNKRNDDYFYWSDSRVFSGNITFTASPSVSQPYVIKLTEEQTKVFEAEIPEECIVKDEDSLRMRLSSLFNETTNKVNKVNIYHVGSGYYSYFQCRDGSRFFYDIGLTQFGDRDEIKCPDHGYDNFKFGILSHWDRDHFMGITRHNSDKQDIILSKPWICPSIISGTNAARLAFQIRYRSKSNLIMIDQSIRGVL